MADLFRPRWREGDDPFRRLVVQTTLRFMEIEAAGGVVLVAAALVALIWVNVDFHSYDSFWHTKIFLDLQIWDLKYHGEPGLSLQHVVNDVLMVVFFLVVGAEIKREVTHGELRNPRQAALPLFAALGGMVVPAAVYVAFNAGGEGGPGWGIPVATDIAFALGVLALAGRNVPIQLKVFLLTLAVADDIGGILIIAIFYSESIQVEWLLGVAGAVAFLLLVKQLGFRHFGIHTIGGIFLWLTLYEAGLHATLAGVILGLIVPADALYDRHGTSRRIDYLLQRLRFVEEDPDEQVREHDAQETLRNIQHVSSEALSPLERLEEFMAPVSAFIVVPIFALANAGIHLSNENIGDAVGSDIALGVFFGLLLGKFVGIMGMSALSVWSGIAVKPLQLRWAHLAGAALLAGIGFTVSIFIANLSFVDVDPDLDLLAEAKIGIFAASIIAASVGFVLLHRTKPRF